jgi:endo-1,4-beta-xylanase
MIYSARTAAAIAVTLMLLPAARAQRPPVIWNNPDPKLPNVEHRSFHSASMGVEVGYNVYLPPGYAQGDRRYPVIYYLHGAPGDENSDAGWFSELVGKQIAAGKIPPVLCIFPNGGRSGYADHPERPDKVRGETLIVGELLPQVDRTYRTIASPKGRAIAGFSMGGGGAVRLGLRHPDLFSRAGSWGGVLIWFENNPNEASSLARENRDRISGQLGLFVVVGDKDPTFRFNQPFIETLKELKLPHEYRVLEGVGHDRVRYSETTGEEMIRFLTAGFKS